MNVAKWFGFHWGRPWDDLGRRLDEVLSLLREILTKESIMSEQMDRLEVSVKGLTTVAGSILTLIDGLAQQIRDNATDPIRLAALADELDKDKADLAAAILANTPAAPVA